MLNYFIYNFSRHSHLKDSFLHNAKLAHNSQVKSTLWFNWKFIDNPFGESILACAEDNEKIIGCVAYGIQPFLLENKIIKGVISFETFVHPDYQGLGVFSKLLKLAEKEVTVRNIDLMLNFPNTNSLKGFLKNGWNQIESPEYWIKVRKLWSIPFALKDIRQGFKPLQSNFKELTVPETFEQKPITNLYSEITLKYLKWRFFTHPVSEYVIIDTSVCYSVVRMGNRGKIREAQVLFINIKDDVNFSFKDFLLECKSKTNYDIVSLSISKYNPIRKKLKRNHFIKVPNQTNICYKILNHDAINPEEVKKISISAINYHTY